MSNPVFGRIDKDISSGYAQFGGAPAQQAPGPRGSRYGQVPPPQQYNNPYGGSTPQDQWSSQRLEDMYQQPPASPTAMGRLTTDDVVMKFLGLFAIVLVGAVFTGLFLPGGQATLILPAIVLTLVLGLIIAFKKSISVPLIVAYAVVEGVLVGTVSRVYANAFGDNVVNTAVIATLSVFAGMFFAWKSGMIKVTDKFRRFMVLAVFGYMIFALANLVAAWAFRANEGWGFFGFGSAMSIGISILAVGLASFSLVMDFDAIDRAVTAGVPQKYSWLLAHGLVVTVVWLYLELLRLIAQFSGRD